MVSQGMVDPIAYKEANDQFYADYERGEMDLQAYLKFSLAPLSRYSLEELDLLHQQFMREVITPMRLTKADELLAEHRAKGDYLLVITSTNGFITTPIANALNVDFILATDAEIIDHHYSGEIVGTPCFQGGKITRLHQWLETAADFGFSGNLEGAYFYSDSINDLPLLQQIDNPIAVDPDDALREYAKQHHWPIISLR